MTALPEEVLEHVRRLAREHRAECERQGCLRDHERVV
jgi:hypothetical protein